DEDAGAVTGVGLGPLRAAVIEVAQRLDGPLDDAMAGPPPHVDDERDAARVVLEARVVKATCCPLLQRSLGPVGPRLTARLRLAVVRLGRRDVAVRHSEVVLGLDAVSSGV